MNLMRYSGVFYMKKHSLDLGIDLYAAESVVIQPGEIGVIDTGAILGFPIYTKARRFLTRLIFGIDITGIGGLIWPRGRSDYAILSGVVDAGYRGTIKVKVLNTTGDLVKIERGGRFAQIVLVPVFHPELSIVAHPDIGTSLRGDKGGINNNGMTGD